MQVKKNRTNKFDKKMSIKVSIIIPVYQVADYLDQCVQSVVEQTYTCLEIILVDDGSTDASPGICDAWARKDSRIKVIHKANGGLSDARNAGLDVANGDWITFVDSDDWIALQMVEKMLNIALQDKSDIVACGIMLAFEDDSNKNHLMSLGQNLTLDCLHAQRALLEEKEIKQPACGKLYRKETIQGLHFPFGKYHEDVFWSYRAIGKANQVSIIDYVGYYYRQRGGSIMNSSFSLKRLDALEAICERYDYMKLYFPSLAKTALVRIWGQCIYFGQMAMVHSSGDVQKHVFDKLLDAMKSHPISFQDYAEEHFAQRLWLSIARVSLKLTCTLKNWMHVGL